ncbi:ammonium transporter [Stylonychia lemnae]|uniref:Ammonium transporter n=1 Tax=Stylonychia lemnae TaxID=5949 RepID=A0A078B8L4_STYLE|nr:ammonium transporter [Stylonychia lemnae]|eukprot:CDW89642.1 ammonium transporter [Stylonychia lemnae]
MSTQTGVYSNYQNTTDEQVNEVWILVSAAFILLMQIGTGLFNAGSSQQKSHQSIFAMKLFEACLGTIGFWLFGYGLAFGKVRKYYGDDSDYFVSRGFEKVSEDNYTLFMFQVAFSLASTTMISGSMAERAQLPQQILFTFLEQSFIYPVVIAWVWGGGWLAQNGYHDFAGSGCIHVLGGTCALVGSAVLGPRLNRFKIYTIDDLIQKEKNLMDDTLQANPIIKFKPAKLTKKKQKLNDSYFENGHIVHIMRSLSDKNKQRFKKWILDYKFNFTPSNTAYLTLGTFINWIGWLFFNAGSTLSVQTMRNSGPSKIMFNTILASSVSGLVVVFLKPHFLRNYTKLYQYDVGQFCNGICAGLISITAPCDCVEPWAAILIGFIGGLFFIFGSMILIAFKVDDPVDAIPCHFFAGIWGVLAVGIFHRETGLVNSEYAERFHFLGWQIASLLSIIAWAGGISLIYFLIARRLKLLRVHPLVEIIGLDRAYFGGLTKKDLKMLKDRYSIGKTDEKLRQIWKLTALDNNSNSGSSRSNSSSLRDGITKIKQRHNSTLSSRFNYANELQVLNLDDNQK